MLTNLQLKQLASLLEQGYPLDRCLHLMQYQETKHSNYFEMCDFIKNHVSAQMYVYISFFFEVCSYSEAIQHALAISQTKKSMKQLFLKDALYPICIFFMSFFTLLLFANYVIPQLLESFDTIQNSPLIFAVYIIQYSSIIFLLVLVLGTISWFILKQQLKKDKSCYVYWNQKVPFLQSIQSYYFCLYYDLLSSKGLSSIDCLEGMLLVNEKQMGIHIVQEVKYQLKKGVNFMQCIEHNPFLCSICKQYFMIGILNGNIHSDLQSYLVHQQEIWKRKIKQICMTIQFIAYICIGILMICVYQIMLLPLEMFQTF